MTTHNDESLKPTREEMIAFLNGSGEIDGLMFGEPSADKRPMFWWRKYLDVLSAPKGNAAQEWLPIESAPKDQELLLVDAEGTRVVGRWGKHNHVPLYGWIRQVELYGEEVDGFDAIAYMPIAAAPSNKEVER